MAPPKQVRIATYIVIIAPFVTIVDYVIQAISLEVYRALGASIALVIMAGIREQLELADVPGLAKGAAVSLMLAGILSLAFLGFAGLGG